MDNKKKVAAALAATIAASGAAVDMSFDDPADLLQQDAGIEPKIEYVDLENGPDDGQTADDEEKQKPAKSARTGSLREWILGLPLAVRALFILPQWFIGHLILTGGSVVFAGLSPVLHWLLGFVLLALVIAGAFTVTAKAMFPDLPLGKILNRHSIKWILIVSAVIFLADIVLGMTWSGYAHVKTLVTGLFTLAGLTSIVVWFARREHRRRASLCMAEEIPEEPEEPEELVYSSLGETFTIRPPRP